MSLDELIDRDGARCAWCGAAPWPQDLTFEHVLPRSGGGTTVAENGLVACRRCNRARGSRPVVAYVRELQETGAEPQVGVIRAALERLAASERRRHREFGARQAELLARLGAERSSARSCSASIRSPSITGAPGWGDVSSRDPARG